MWFQLYSVLAICAYLGIATFTAANGDAHAILTMDGGQGAQFVDVSDLDNPVAVGTHAGVFSTVTTVTLANGKPYAIFAVDEGIEIVDVSDPTNPVRKDSATDGVGGYEKLDGARSISAFTGADGKAYAIVVSDGADTGFQIVRLEI